MRDLDSLPFSQGDAEPTVNVTTKRRHRHVWYACHVANSKPFYYHDAQDDGQIFCHDGYACTICGAVKDEVRSRRGRTSLRAGKDAERAIAKSYGGRRTGHFGGPDDVVVGELFTIQSKAGGWFSERVWAELVKLPRAGGRIPTLIVSDRPGPGHRTRRYVIRLMADDLALHGPTP